MLLDMNAVIPAGSASTGVGKGSILPKVTVTAANAQNKSVGWWAGMTGANLSLINRMLYSMGTISQAHYIVDLEPYDATGALSDLPIFDKKPLSEAGFSLTGAMLPWLATSCNMSLLDMQSDSVQAGHFQQNYLTANSASEVQVTFLETKRADILNSMISIKRIMLNDDGTMGLPADYMMRLKISLFRRDNRDDRVFSQSWLVALQAASVDLAAQNKDALEVPITFLKMYPML